MQTANSLTIKDTTMKTFTATFKRQLFPWSDPYKTTRDINAKDKWQAMEIAEQIAVENTHEFDVQGGGRSFVGKMLVLSVKIK